MNNTAIAEQIQTLQAGDKAPDFKLETDNGGTVSLAEFKGKKNVVLYFYPKDDTPGCTLEAQGFRDNKEKFAAADTVIIGLSKDNCKSHDKFKNKYELNFQLASDESGEVCNNYNTWVEKSMYGKKYMGIQRDTFLIDKQGKIAQIWRKVKVDGHVDEVLEAVKNLK